MALNGLLRAFELRLGKLPPFRSHHCFPCWGNGESQLLRLPAGDTESLLTIVNGLMTIVNLLALSPEDYTYQYLESPLVHI